MEDECVCVVLLCYFDLMVDDFEVVDLYGYDVDVFVQCLCDIEVVCYGFVNLLCYKGFEG